MRIPLRPVHGIIIEKTDEDKQPFVSQDYTNPDHNSNRRR